jgi:hypothetical protein
MPAGQTKSRIRLALKIFALVVVALLAWVAFDLYAPRTAHLREFDAGEVARLETAMWRSYYEKQRLQLFNQLSQLLRTQYNMPLVRSNQVAYYAADAAFVFKKGKQRADYEKALPDLIKFYQSIRKMSDIPFDPERAARLELEWWIIHRERAKHAPGELDRCINPGARSRRLFRSRTGIPACPDVIGFLATLKGQTGMSVLLSRRTGPRPIFRSLDHSCFHWVPFDITHDPIKLIFISDCVIKGFVLPELLPSTTQQLITFVCRVSLDGFGNSVQ